MELKNLHRHFVNNWGEGGVGGEYGKMYNQPH